MKSLYSPPWSSTDEQKRTLRSQAEELVRLRGTTGRPDPPRDLQIQSGSRKVTVTWSRPVNFGTIASWRVYKGDESTLYQAIKDVGTRYCDVAANSGSTPPTTNIFVSSVSASGAESQKVQIQGTATAEAGAPTDPGVPPGYTAGGSGGGSLSGGGTGSTGRDRTIL